MEWSGVEWSGGCDYADELVEGVDVLEGCGRSLVTHSRPLRLLPVRSEELETRHDAPMRHYNVQ